MKEYKHTYGLCSVIYNHQDTKIWKQPKNPSIDKWIKQLWDIYTIEYYLTIKIQEQFTLCDIVDVPGQHYTKWNKLFRDRQIPYDLRGLKGNGKNTINKQKSWTILRVGKNVKLLELFCILLVGMN